MHDTDPPITQGPQAADSAAARCRPAAARQGDQ